jgi:hypothetical protein
MANIRINSLPPDAAPSQSDVLPVDGLTTRKTTIVQMVNAARPFASQAQAEAGVATDVGMNPLTTKQAIEGIGGALFATSAEGDLAATALQPAAIGTTVQAHAALLDSVSGLALSTGDILYATGSDTVARLPIGPESHAIISQGGLPVWSPAGVGDLLAVNNLSDVDNTTTARTNLGAQAANANLTTLAGVTPGAAGLRVLAEADEADVNADSSIMGSKVNPEFMHSSAPFGRGGFRILRGSKFDAHYGWGGIVAFPSGKWVNIYRVGTDHGITDGSVVYAEDSYDKGNSWENRRVVYTNALSDARPDPAKLMANNRMGFFVNRQDEGGTHFSPLFIYSDDEGVNFTTTTVTTIAPYTFQATGGIMEFPASVGGHDTLGFMAFGFLSAGGMDAFTTIDNGLNWTQVNEVAVATGTVTALSENWGFRVGTQDKWIFFSRAQDAGGWRQMLTVFVTTNPLNWGPCLDAGVNLGGNPPGGLYDPDTNKLHLLNFGRGGRGITVGSVNFEHHIMHIEVDADALYNASGSFSALGLSYSVLAVVPNWATGYIAPFYDDGWWASFTCAEPGTAGGAKSALALVGDFIPTMAENAKWIDLLMRRQMNIRSIDVQADDNTVTTYPIKSRNLADNLEAGFGAYGFSNRIGTTSTQDYTFDIGGDLILDCDVGYVQTPSGQKMILGGTAETSQLGMLTAHIPGTTTAGLVTASLGSNTVRTHWAGMTLSGLAGQITCTNATTSYVTTSDETWKHFLGAYEAAEAIRVIRADPVRRFRWDDEHGGEEAVGWGAQTSYAVSPDLASPGGWFNADGEPCDPATEGAVYIPWGVDPAKRTPHLWAAVAWLLDERDAMTEQIKALDARLNALEAA